MKIFVWCWIFIFILRVHATTFSCSYSEPLHYLNLKVYECIAKIANITEIGTFVTLSASTHLASKTDKDVTSFYIESQVNIHYFPQGLEKIFENLLAIDISGSGLKEVHQQDLKPFGKLKILSFPSNPIEYLEPDLFKFNPHLEYINFDLCKISYIHPNVFDSLSMLRTLRLASNTCIGKIVDDNKAEVQKLIEDIKTNCANSPQIMHFMRQVSNYELFVSLKNGKFAGRFLELESNQNDSSIRTKDLSSNLTELQIAHKGFEEKFTKQFERLDLSQTSAYKSVKEEFTKQLELLELSQNMTLKALRDIEARLISDDKTFDEKLSFKTILNFIVIPVAVLMLIIVGSVLVILRFCRNEPQDSEEDADIKLENATPEADQEHYEEVEMRNI